MSPRKRGASCRGTDSTVPPPPDPERPGSRREPRAIFLRNFCTDSPSSVHWDLNVSSESIPLDQLLARTDWLRTLARHLIDDPDAAEDVVQDAVVAALQQPESRVRNWHGWLSRVVRHTALRRRRADNLRRQHERSHHAASIRGASTTNEPPADSIVAQARLQRRIVGFVLRMDPPYRDTLLLRYWDDLSPKLVATQMGVPIDTVYASSAAGSIDFDLGSRPTRAIGAPVYYPWPSVPSPRSPQSQP